MGNMSNSTLGRRLGRQMSVNRVWNGVTPSFPSIVSSTTAAIQDGRFYGRMWAPRTIFDIFWWVFLTAVSSASLSIIPFAVIPGMERHSWATSEQLDFLKSFTHLLPQAKVTTGLNTFYVQIYESFLKKWSPEPFIPKPGISLTPEVLEAKAKEKLQSVRILLNYLCSRTYNLPAHQQLVQRSAKEGEVLGPPRLQTSTSHP